MEIVRLHSSSDQLEEGIQFFWKCWGSESNFSFYQDCILHSLQDANTLPNFYLLLDQEKIVGSYALLTNDIISRQDLFPWFACLYVVEDQRGKGLAGQLLEHGLHETRRLGFEHLYLSTDLIGFYEKKGWQLLTQAFGVGGDAFNVYFRES